MSRKAIIEQSASSQMKKDEIYYVAEEELFGDN